MKIGNKAIYKFRKDEEWYEKECTIEKIEEDYITVRIPGPLGGTLHMACPECVRVIEE